MDQIDAVLFGALASLSPLYMEELYCKDGEFRSAAPEDGLRHSLNFPMQHLARRVRIADHGKGSLCDVEKARWPEQ